VAGQRIGPLLMGDRVGCGEAGFAVTGSLAEIIVSLISLPSLWAPQSMPFTGLNHGLSTSNVAYAELNCWKLNADKAGSLGTV
jgi:hypothetical protein